ncbi:hypothetical protein ACN429_11740 [Pseudomonas oryzihabitans]|uniref:hypothetical protein n=1 Tax=Pseudomonas oryzihabitans TaxID=47885 RepID=UPI003B225D36
MVNLGNGAETDQVLDEAGKGGDIGHAAEDGGRAREAQPVGCVATVATNRNGSGVVFACLSSAYEAEKGEVTNVSSPVINALAQCETVIAHHELQIGKYELLLARTSRKHPYFGTIKVLLISEQERLQLEQDHRLRLLDRMYYASQQQAVGSGL